MLLSSFVVATLVFEGGTLAVISFQVPGKYVE